MKIGTTVLMLGVLWVALACLTPAGAEKLVIVENGRPMATVVIAADAGEKVKLAASELQTYIEKMSGAKLTLTTDASEPKGALILVGRSKFTDAMGVEIPSGVTGARREEGFVISCKGDRMLLAGNDEEPYHGTEYAVYELLNRLGVRWFMPGQYGEIVPSMTTIALDAVNIKEKPDFIMRNWWLHTTPELAEQEARWKIRNKMNPAVIFQTPADSTAQNILPESVYFKDHPEYFALNPDGTRNPHLPNLTNPKAIEIAAGIIKDYFRANPGANSYGFAPDDGAPVDFSPDTLKLNQGIPSMVGRPGVPSELSISAEWFTFVSKVTSEVRKEFPEVYIATNGYTNRDIPPQGIALDDHMILMFAAIWSCTLHSYDDEHCWQKVRQGQMLKRWTELCPNVWIYGYNYEVLVSALTPLPEVNKLRRDFPLMKKWGVIGFLDETRNQWAECGIPSRYLRARLEWNANLDVDGVLDDFYPRWYGKAAGPMRKFYDSLETAVEATDIHPHEDRALATVYTPELMGFLKKCIVTAERLTDTERGRLHVQADRLIYEHLQCYVAMCAAEANGDYADAAKMAGRMMDLRKELHEIDPFYIWDTEGTLQSGIWYWGVTDRQKYYQSLVDKTSGAKGEIVVRLPSEANFRTDPRDEGMFAEWFKTGASSADWKSIDATKPFYLQGYMDKEGFPYTGSMWYRFRVDVPASARGKKMMLYFPVVETEGWCWVNGKFVGNRPYRESYIRPNEMELDVTDAIRAGEENEIAVRVHTSLAASQCAAGLQARGFLYSPK